VSARLIEGAIDYQGAEARTAESPATRITPAVLSTDLVRRLIAKEAQLRLSVRGAALRPALRSGDRVTLAAPTRPPTRGDLVALQTEEGLVVRRYVGRRSDGPTSDSSPVGDVVAVERQGRRIDFDATRGERWRIAAAGLARRCRATARLLLGRLSG
jgi:hypothetical protein